MNSVVFTRSRLRTLGFVLGAAMFIGVGYLLANDPELSLYRRAWGWICIAFFGAVFLSASWSLFRGGRMFTLDPSGITDHHRGVVISWGEVQKVRVVNVQGARFLGLVFHQPAQATVAASAHVGGVQRKARLVLLELHVRRGGAGDREGARIRSGERAGGAGLEVNVILSREDGEGSQNAKIKALGSRLWALGKLLIPRSPEP